VTPIATSSQQWCRSEPVNLFEAVLLIAAAANPSTALVDLKQSELAMASLAQSVPTSGQAVDRLHTVLSEFHGTPADYETLDGSLMPAVLRSRHGLPILLSVTWLEVARRREIPAYGVGLPGHFVVAIGDPDGYHELVDPFGSGRRLRPHEVSRIVGRPVAQPDMRPWEPLEILQRILANIRAWAGRPDRLGTRRWALDYTLALPRHAVDVERQHAEVLAQLGGFREAAQGMEHYADLISPANSAAAEAAMRKARQFRAQLN